MRNRLASALMRTAVLVVICVFIAIAGHLMWHGLGDIDFDFLFALPQNAGRDGGISSIVISTLLILLICMAVALPVGVATAILLSEFTSQDRFFGTFVRRSLDLLAGVPSIVYGLFGSVFFCRIMGLGFSILAGGLTLACMVLPILIRTTEEGLRLVPPHYRQSAEALAFSKCSILIHLVLPAAVPGLIVGLVLGVGRAMAETAALIFTSGYVDRMPESIMDSGRALSVHIFDLSMNVPGGDLNAYKSAVFLLILVFMINGMAMMLTDRFLKKRIIAQ